MSQVNDELKSLIAMMVIDYFVAWGVLLGGALIGGLGAFLVGEPPMNWVHNHVEKLKIWALVTAIGGTFDTITAIEKGFFGEYYGEMVKHFLYIGSAFLGAHSASILINWMIGEIR